ncbi:MAG: peroxiredoxin [Deltaproteobacteria bacterium]|nr:peroxiredoxin [Deltaproteobacteria bacterium]
MKAKNFSLLDRSGAKRSLSEFKGSWVVVYFYPKDFTSGCTREACAFRDAAGPLKKLGAVVIGISKDSAESHAKFDDKHELGFLLLSDPDCATAKAWGAFGMKNMYGKKVEGVKRSTFLIGPGGEVAGEWIGVKVDGHVDAVVEALREAKKK